MHMLTEQSYSKGFYFLFKAWDTWKEILQRLQCLESSPSIAKEPQLLMVIIEDTLKGRHAFADDDRAVNSQCCLTTIVHTPRQGRCSRRTLTEAGEL